VSVYGTRERPVWALTIVGKGQRERTVPVSAAALGALRAHWADRGRDFDSAAIGSAGALAGPLPGPSSFRGPTHRVVGIGRNVATLSKSKRPAIQPMD
jgi:integrase